MPIAMGDDNSPTRRGVLQSAATVGTLPVAGGLAGAQDQQVETDSDIEWTDFRVKPRDEAALDVEAVREEGVAPNLSDSIRDEIGFEVDLDPDEFVSIEMEAGQALERQGSSVSPPSDPTAGGNPVT